MAFVPQPGHEDDPAFAAPRTGDAVLVTNEAEVQRQAIVVSVDADDESAWVRYPNEATEQVPFGSIEVL